MSLPARCDPSAPHAVAIRVYYEDTDFTGVVYHANYLRFFERGRTEFLRGLGLGQRALHGETGGIAFVVRHIVVDFLRPARMDDLLQVETDLAALGGASVEVSQTIRKEAEILTRASVKLALVQAGRVIRLPPAMRQRLESVKKADGSDVRPGKPDLLTSC
jgi:acyl-CoA thioester hydrolase